jgi:putative spermidine/putrescine transport system permease protein
MNSSLTRPESRAPHGFGFLRTGVLLGIVLAVIVPFVPLVLYSISLRWFYPAITPNEYSLRGWTYLASPSSRLLESLLTSLSVSSLVTLIATLIALPAGRALGLHHFKGKTLVRFLLLAPSIVPGLAVVMGIHILFVRYGLADTFLGVVIAHLIPVTPIMVTLLAGVFANFETRHEDQARVLGATPWRAFWHVTLPGILPGMIVAALFAFVISWNEYILTFLIGGGQVATLPILLFSLIQGGDNAITAATAIVFALPAMIVLGIATRFASRQGFRP